MGSNRSRTRNGQHYDSVGLSDHTNVRTDIPCHVSGTVTEGHQYSFRQLSSRAVSCIIRFLGLAILFTASTYGDDTSELLNNYCIDCHGAPDEAPEAGFSLTQLIASAPLHTSGPTWKKALDAVEGHDMPPADAELPSLEERQQLLKGIRDVLKKPSLETDNAVQPLRDPGRPVLRRLTRLEYNNTVRDLLGLGTDVLMFSERLPFGREHYQPASGTLPDRLTMGAREYGAKYNVLLRDASMPGDSRAEYGFTNRGDAQNLSAVRLAQYVKLAGEIAFHPELLSRARRMEELFPKARYQQPTRNTSLRSKPLATSDAGLATNNNVARTAQASYRTLEEFQQRLDIAFAEDRGGVFSGEELRNSTIAGKGGLIRITYGRSAIRTLAVNPNEDIWLAAFSTAAESSGDTLMTNYKKQQRNFELTFQGAGSGRFAGIAELGIVLLSRRDQQGTIRLKATFDDSSTDEISVTLRPGVGTDNTFVAIVAPGERTIRRLAIDGSDFSGDYVLLDDFSFVTRDAPNRKPLVQAEAPARLVEPEDVKPEVKMDRSIAQRSPTERLQHFLRRAFRREITDDEVEVYLSLYQTEIDRGGSDEAAMRSAIQGILASPNFLYVVVDAQRPS
ncbi:MAG TPA: hypothetical protein DDW52_01090, partial [Planctomycetaceae bacterium]|nr:hypothetical protein [Planctomycetaceae bacterium]